MGKGRNKRRRKLKDVVRPAKVEPPPAEPLSPADPDAPVLSPLKPRPSLRSGAVALAEPDEQEDILQDLVGVTLRVTTRQQ
jgi:hypothetical protein